MVGRLWEVKIYSRMFINGTIIKVYKYACAYNQVGFQSGLDGLVIQSAVQAILAHAGLTDQS